MRKIDENKDSILGMAAKTINFEKIVLKKLESKARQQGTTVSKIVNLMCRKIILNDIEYHKAMMKHYYLKFQEYRYLKEQAEATIEVNL